jgi:hypothetical protein
VRLTLEAGDVIGACSFDEYAEATDSKSTARLVENSLRRAVVLDDINHLQKRKFERPVFSPVRCFRGVRSVVEHTRIRVEPKRLAELRDKYFYWITLL